MANFTNPTVQASRLIQFIGDTVSDSEEPIAQLPAIAEIIGAPSEESAVGIALQLHETGLIRTQVKPVKLLGGGIIFLGVDLTLRGWTRFEEQAKQTVAQEEVDSSRSHKYDITLSFAGEDREYARKLVFRHE